MTLSFHEIGLRWPDAVVYWDRDVAPTLDWEPAFVDVDGVLWAVEGGMKCGGVFGRTARSGCRCLVWDGERWIGHNAWDKLQLARQLTGPVAWSSDPTWEREYLGRWVDQPRSDMADAIAYAYQHMRRPMTIVMGQSNMLAMSPVHDWLNSLPPVHDWLNSLPPVSPARIEQRRRRRIRQRRKERRGWA